MTVKLKKTQKINPRQIGEPAKWYLTPSGTGPVTIKEIVNDIVKQTSLARGDVQNVLTSLIDVMPGYMLLGHSIRLGEFGSFRISVSSEGKDTPEALAAKDVKKARILFTPGTELKRSIDGVSFEVLA